MYKLFKLKTHFCINFNRISCTNSLLSCEIPGETVKHFNPRNFRKKVENKWMLDALHPTALRQEMQLWPAHVDPCWKLMLEKLIPFYCTFARWPGDYSQKTFKQFIPLRGSRTCFVASIPLGFTPFQTGIRKSGYLSAEVLFERKLIIAAAISEAALNGITTIEPQEPPGFEICAAFSTSSGWVAISHDRTSRTLRVCCRPASRARLKGGENA